MDRPPTVGRFDLDLSREWSRKLYDAGYVGITWPKEYGGGGLPHTYQGIYLEETARIGAPDHIGGIGLGMAGPPIIARGKEGPEKRYPPPLLFREGLWWPGFSEAGSGADHPGAQTRPALHG